MVPAHLVVLAAGGFLAGYSLASHEVQRLRRRLAHARHALTHDPLTGLPNRTAVTSHLTAALAAREPVCVALFDLDEFKEVNDRLGHNAGDRALQMFAHHLTRNLTETAAMVARLHGDEFLAVFDTDLQAATAAVTAAWRAFADTTIAIDGTPVNLQATAGIAQAQPGTTVGTLLHHADAAMYHAKRTRSGVRTYRPPPGQQPLTPQPRPQRRRRDQPRNPQTP